MPDVAFSYEVKLRPNDTKRGLKVRAPICSSASANDGYIPFGSVISSVTHTITREDGTDQTTAMTHANPSVVDNEYVNIELKAPSTMPAVKTKHLLTLIMTLSTGEVKEARVGSIFTEP